jgi:ATPase subunit of ABC transporter with duplicated ATPase domains
MRPDGWCDVSADTKSHREIGSSYTTACIVRSTFLSVLSGNVHEHFELIAMNYNLEIGVMRRVGDCAIQDDVASVTVTQADTIKEIRDLVTKYTLEEEKMSGHSHQKQNKTVRKRF